MSNVIHHFAPTGAWLRTGTRCLLLLTLLVSFELTALAQTAARPDRGFQSSGSYAVSDIESVNLTSGNVNLSIPLASLPPIAGGKLSFTLSATYNSKLWDVTRYQVKQNEPPIYNYIVDTPQLSATGGWQLFGGYKILFRDSHEDYDWVFPASTESDYNYIAQHQYWHKRFVITPDGAEHELRPLGYSPYSGARSYLWGYYEDSPDSPNQPISYYTIDGTYLWVKIYPLNHPSGISSEIYTRDGSVVRITSGLQRIIDPNGNEIRIWSDTEATHYMDQQTGREIKVTSPSPGISRVSYQAVGGTWMHTDVVWGTTEVQRQTYWTHVPQEDGGDCENPTILYGVSVDVVREIILPQSEPGQTVRHFTFSYNSDTTEAVNLNWWPSCEVSVPITSASRGWGALKQMVMPSGTVINYSHSLDTIHELVDPNEASRERITSKSVTHDGETNTWTYSENSVTNPDASYVTEFTYPKDVAFPSTWGGPTGLAGLVYRTNQSNKVVVERQWARKVFSGAVDNFTGVGMAVFNPVVVAEYTSLLDDSPSHNPVKMSARTYQYDYNGNLLEEKSYDWFDPALVQRDSFGVPTAVPAGATLLRTNSHSYYNQASSSSSSNVYAKRSLTTATPLILNAPQQNTVGPAVTQLSYDGQAYGIAPTAGNLTSKSVWDNVNNSWITSDITYGLYGNVASTRDGRGKVTQCFYDDATHALPTRIVVDPENGTGTQTTTAAYDFSTGLVISTTDPNLNTSTIDYTNQLLGTVDPFGRPGVEIGPDLGSGLNQRVKYIYEDNARTATVLSDLNAEGDGLLKTQVLTDMLGRVVESRQFETLSTFIAVRKSYDIPNRLSKTSNPFRDGETISWTTTTTDLLGRVVSVKTPDNAIVLTSYDANSVTTTDPTGKQRKGVTDALGRIKEVYEDPTPNGLNYQTTYVYDTLDNLVKVTQGSQQRFFMYDSLKRLIRSRTPEQGTHLDLNLLDPITGNNAWSIAYEYDANGNLTKKTDARNVYSTYVYDALNRNTTINYSDTPINPDVKRFYDGATKGIGRFWYSYRGGDYSNGDNVEHTSVDSYDAVGRPLVQRQLFKLNGTWSSTYQTSRTYNLAGGVLTQIYPSNHTVSYTYDSAGRTATFSGNLGGDPRTYATGITYSSWNSPSREQFGTNTPLYHKSFYNIRGQLFDTRLSSVNDTWDWNRGRLILYYSSNHAWGQSGTDNNGNLRFAETWIPPENATLDQTDTLFEDAYTYDVLNRLTSVAGQKLNVAGGGSWQPQFRQSYDYDRYGNRTINTDPLQTWGTGINNKQFTKSDLTNRLGVPTGQSGTMSYDAAGNLLTDTYTGAGDRVYDAENKMTRAWGGNNQWQDYTYNADGQRTRRKINGQETWQLYGIDGELLAEYAANSSPSTPQSEYGYRNGQLLISTQPAAAPTPSPTPWNAALAFNGASVTSSSTLSPYYAGYVIDGSRKAVDSAGWLDSTYNSFPDWMEISFNGSETISEINVITQQDDPQNLVEPTLTQTFSLYGITAYDVQYWNGSAWSTVPGGSVTGNNKVWRKFTFSPITTTKIRLVVNGGADNTFSRVVEVEAWTNDPKPSLTNYAKATNGSSVSASSTLSPYFASYVIDGSRKAVNSAGWLDNTYNSFPDWIEVSFNGSKTISEIDVITQQDDPQHLVEPMLTQTFSLYGITAFDVQYWTGSAWATVPGGSVTGNNKVWRQFTFSPITTTKIRLVVNAGADNAYCRVVEVEAWGQPAPTTTTSINWVVSDHLGTPRMISDQTGTLANIKRHDYLPFGEELLAPAGGRTSSLGYTGSDGVRQQFTQKERDLETGLDYFGARYYQSTQGRFTSPDSFAGSKFTPQSLNLYSYVQNNPLRYIDPTGHFGIDSSIDPFDCPLCDEQDPNKSPLPPAQKEGDPYPVAACGGCGSPFGVIANVTVVGEAQTLSTTSDVTATSITSRPELPFSPIDLLPGFGPGRQFLYDYNTHEFEHATLSFGLMALDLSPLGGLSRGEKGLSLGLRYAPEAAEVGLEGFKHAATYGVESYNTLHAMVKGTGLQVHHLVEKRFAKLLEISPGKMKSIVLTPEEHAVFTKAWRQAIPYGQGTINATKQQVTAAARKIYENYPAIRSALGIP